MSVFCEHQNLSDYQFRLSTFVLVLVCHQIFVFQLAGLWKSKPFNYLLILMASQGLIYAYLLFTSRTLESQTFAQVSCSLLCLIQEAGISGDVVRLGAGSGGEQKIPQDERECAQGEPQQDCCCWEWGWGLQHFQSTRKQTGSCWIRAPTGIQQALASLLSPQWGRFGLRACPAPQEPRGEAGKVNIENKLMVTKGKQQGEG